MTIEVGAYQNSETRADGVLAVSVDGAIEDLKRDLDGDFEGGGDHGIHLPRVRDPSLLHVLVLLMERRF